MNINELNKVALFSRTGAKADMLQLQADMVASGLFKLPTKNGLTDKTDIDTQDVMIVESNVSDFITVWARHERKGKKTKESASYGIRVKTALGDIPALKVLLGDNISFNDSSEYRVTCYSVEDVKTFVGIILQALQAHAVKAKSKEVQTPTEVTA